jgi:CDP-diacylglycerol---serine O-phosphatidyltransferase
VTPRIRRPDVRRAAPMLPNGFTLANLFFGIYAMITASRGDFSRAGLYIIIGGVADALDGRIARATRSGSRFGEELDSLVDAISFGLAPAIIMYFAVLNKEGWDWIFVFLFSASAVMRLARFNIEQAGRAKTYFLGLPSPAAGMTLATYYWFSQTQLYSETVIGNLPWHQMLRFVMAGLSFLMISNVPYAAVPRIGFRTLKGLMGTVVIAGTIAGLIFLPREFFFPALLVYIVYGVAKAFVLGLMDRLPTGPTVDEDEESYEDEEYGVTRHGPPATAYAAHGDGAGDHAPGSGRRRRRRRRRTGHTGERPTPRQAPPIEEHPE